MMPLNAPETAPPSTSFRVNFLLQHLKRARILNVYGALLRVTLLALFLFVGSGFFLVRSARASLERHAFSILELLEAHAAKEDPRTLGQPYSSMVHLNGVPLRLTTTSVSTAPGRTLAVIRKSCPQLEVYSGGLSNEPDSSTAVCVAGNGGLVTNLIQLASTYLESGESNTFGELRVYFVRRVGDASRVAGSQVLEIFVPPGALTTFFKDTGDASGVDPSFAPRPAGRRVLNAVWSNASTKNKPLDLFFAYTSAGTPQEQLDTYVKELERNGYTLDRKSPQGATVLRNAETTLFVYAIGDPALGKTDEETLLFVARLP